MKSTRREKVLKIFKKISLAKGGLTVLVLFMLANIVLAGFLLCEIKRMKHSVISINAQFNNINRSLSDIQKQQEIHQSYLTRLQSLLYRFGAGGE
ncbi:hypothetical protein KAI65_05330 [Candidatus Parcubacteria bacterium]|nr:hypothetical protein [Candidatus Parcubacteria bacterium]